MKSLRDIKSNDKARPSFRINDKANLTHRYSSTNQGNTSAINFKSITN